MRIIHSLFAAASLAVAGQNLVGLAFTPTGGAFLTTTIGVADGALYDLTLGIQGLPLT